MPPVKKKRSGPKQTAAKTESPGPEATPDQKAPEQNNGCQMVRLEVPLGEIPETRFPIHLDIRLKSDMASVLRRIAVALDKKQATLSNGRRVIDSSSAMRWLIEQVKLAS